MKPYVRNEDGQATNKEVIVCRDFAQAKQLANDWIISCGFRNPSLSTDISEMINEQIDMSKYKNHTIFMDANADCGCEYIYVAGIQF